jgi:hypothetical protein
MEEPTDQPPPAEGALDLSAAMAAAQVRTSRGAVAPTVSSTGVLGQHLRWTCTRASALYTRVLTGDARARMGAPHMLIAVSGTAACDRTGGEPYPGWSQHTQTGVGWGWHSHGAGRPKR